MFNLKDTEKGLEFGRKASAELKARGEKLGWEILADGFMKAAQDMVIELKHYQPNRSLTRDRLYKLCNQNRWFDHGTVTQYQLLFDKLDEGASTHDLALLIWICSDTAEWTVESIQKILDRPLFAAVHHGEIHYIGEQDETESFLRENDEDGEWEMCEYSKED